MWDGSLQIHIVAEPTAAGKVCGMCGNNNGLPDDDAVLPTGARATGGAEVGVAWRMNEEDHCKSLDELCLARDQRKNAFANENCKILLSGTVDL